MTGGGRSAPSSRQVVAIALAWLAIGITWAATIGRYGGPDEPAHVLRAYAVAHGDVEGVPVESLPSGYRGVTVPRSLGTGDPACYRHDPTVPSTCSVADAPIRDDGDSSGDTVFVATSAGVAPPLYYALIGVPARLIGADDDPLAYRLAALLWVVVVLTAAAVRAWPLGRDALVMLVLVPPSAWFLVGVANPNSLEVALAALAWVGVARARRDSTPSVRDGAWMAIPLGLAVAMRPIALVAVLAVTAVLLTDRRTRPSPRGIALLLAPTAVGAASGLVWQRLIRWDGTDPRTAVSVSVWHAVRTSVGGLGRTAGELVGTTGWLEVSLPVVVRTAWVLLMAAVVTVVALGSRRRAGPAVWRVWTVWLVVLVGTPVAFETAVSSSIGPIWQGRYSVPTFLGLGALTVGRLRPRPLLIAAVVIEVASFVVSVRRYAVGVNGSWLLRGAEPSSRWLAPPTWVVVHTALMVTIGAVLWRAAGSRSEHVAEHVDDHVGVARVVEHGQLPG